MKELNKHQQNLIDQLFEGRLSKSEQARLEKEMDSQEFKEELGIRHDLRKMFAEENAKDPLKKQMQAIEKKIPSKAKPATLQPKPVGGRVLNMRRWLAVAAGVVILVVAGWLGRDLMLESPGSTPIALEFLELPREHNVAGSENPEQLLLNGKDAFFRGEKYEEAGNAFAQIAPSSKYFAEAQYLLAHSLMQQQKFGGAVPLFESFLSDDAKFQQLPSRYRNQDQIRFERMLAYLGAKQNGAFQPELDYFLQHSDSYYKNKAEALAAQLNK